MKFLKEYFDFIGENYQNSEKKEILLKESTPQLKNFVENLKKKLEGGDFLVFDFSGVTLDELIDKDQDKLIPEYVIFKYYSQDYEKRTKHESSVSVDRPTRYFLRVYLLAENENKFLKILNFNNDDYPGVEWLQNENPENVQYPSREESYKPNLLSKRRNRTIRGRVREVLQFEFSTGRKVDMYEDSPIMGSKYATEEVKFAQDFYLKNLIKKLKKNPKIAKYISDDGSVNKIPGVVMSQRPCYGPYGTLFSYDYLINNCKDDYFKKYGCIPLTEFLLELFKILSLDQKLGDRGGLIHVIWDRLFQKSQKEGYCPRDAGCGSLKDEFSTKPNQKSIWQVLLFDKLSNGIPHEKAVEIYNKYLKNPEVYVDPEELFKFER